MNAITEVIEGLLIFREAGVKDIGALGNAIYIQPGEIKEHINDHNMLKLLQLRWRVDSYGTWQIEV